MIKFIPVEELLPLRNAVLREGKLTPDECRFPTDNVAGNFHIGYYIKGELTSIASFHPQKYGQFEGEGYQVRGMATSAKFRGQGIGTRLLNFGIVYLRGQKANYIWCNGRKKALKFYLDMGFEIVSPEFDIPGIGPHQVLYAKIQ
ncbi:GNAT family N-acetyltransferase [Mucilaginibacter sp. UR6-11]|uniref:GNAT family N-acetyltransferase n=1 Tax=Mucilaginibacter sp. UR6-11 TaxID=1435644 RepID=UPI001E2B5EC0|nr:GNAT family N-acetyltransferase [Mucilaginibacter sp. UR6-11]MCC8425709.1 GNAT family N-acetyltransferase [Mucilaginibacter sp. UR6-11]